MTKHSRQHTAPPSGTGTVVTMPERVRVLHQAREAVLTAHPERGERLRELTRMVKAGTYVIEGRTVAQAIARHSTGSRVA